MTFLVPGVPGDQRQEGRKVSEPCKHCGRPLENAHGGFARCTTGPTAWATQYEPASTDPTAPPREHELNLMNERTR